VNLVADCEPLAPRRLPWAVSSMLHTEAAISPVAAAEGPEPLPAAELLPAAIVARTATSLQATDREHGGQQDARTLPGLIRDDTSRGRIVEAIMTKSGSRCVFRARSYRRPTSLETGESAYISRASGERRRAAFRDRLHTSTVNTFDDDSCEPPRISWCDSSARHTSERLV